MKIIDIQEKIVQISSEIKNAYISFAKMDFIQMVDMQ
jgi:hypothetical protein